MKKNFLLLITLCIAVMLQAQVSKTIKVTTPGSLSTSLTATEKSTITSLIVTGAIDARDFKTMRDSLLALTVLDLRVVSIAAYIGNDGTGWQQESYLENTIPQSAFDECSNLTSIILPSSVTAIGESAFYECSSLNSMVIPEGVTSIQSSTFDYCTNLKSVSIPSSVISIGEYAFEDCSSLESITLPSSLARIEDESFVNCTSLTSITIPSSVTQLGAEIFSGCDNLETVIISEGVTYIGRWMFDYCEKLKNLSLPSSLISIGEGAFEDCISLTSVTIPSSVISIGRIAFVGCTGLISVNIPSSVKSIKGSSFSGCSSLSSLALAEGIISIGEGAFNGCTGLTSATIPSTVSSIGEKAFYNCSNLTSVVLNEGVGSIGFLSFANCSSIAEVVIPSSVSLGSNTFDNCKALTSVVLSEGIDSIGFETFMNCSSLTSVTIPSSISYYGYKTFSGCKELKAINSFSISPVKIEFNYAFEDVNKNTCVLNIPFGSKSAYQVAVKWKDFKNIVEMSGFFLSSASVNLAPVLDRKDSIAITSNIAWTASSDQTWLTINHASGTGSGKLTFTATENTIDLSRIAIVTVSATGVPSQTITITQAAGVATLLVSSNSASIAKEAGSTANIDVTTNTIWSAISNQPWLTVSPASGTGNGTLNFTTEANPYNTTRTAIVTVSAEGVTSQIISVTQKAGVETSVADFTNEKVKLYPNPVTDGFWVDGIEGTAKLTIADLNGKVRLSKEIVEHENISVRSLPKGVYFVTIIGTKSKIERKLVKD